MDPESFATSSAHNLIWFARWLLGPQIILAMVVAAALEIVRCFADAPVLSATARDADVRQPWTAFGLSKSGRDTCGFVEDGQGAVDYDVGPAWAVLGRLNDQPRARAEPQGAHRHPGADSAGNRVTELARSSTESVTPSSRRPAASLGSSR